MRFKKVYIEITNRCNFSCSFCFKSVRRKTYISPKDFSAILFSIKPYTNYIYLHVLGEPLLHPEFKTLIDLAHQAGFFINVTTNGSLIEKQKEILLDLPIRQFNVSLHDAEENIPESDWSDYLNSVFCFAKQKSESSYFSLRLWNEGSETSKPFNCFCWQEIERSFNIDLSLQKQDRNIKLCDHIYLQNAARFTWPGEKNLGISHRSCYAIKDHVAILVDGTVVPCCLDADASMALGNVFNEDFGVIISGKRAINIANGFRNNEVVEKICKNCGFVLP